jgi:hypothetical protein
MAVTAVSGTYQCAEIAKIALGFGMDAPMALHPSVYAFVWIAFIGFPCPKKIAGIRSAISVALRQRGHSEAGRRGEHRRACPRRRGSSHLDRGVDHHG